MAISNSIGSNVFDILVGLGLPWALQTLCIDYGSYVSASQLRQRRFCWTRIEQSGVHEGRDIQICCNIQRRAGFVIHKVFVGALHSLSPYTENIISVNWPADYFSYNKKTFGLGVIKVSEHKYIMLACVYQDRALTFKYLHYLTVYLCLSP